MTDDLRARAEAGTGAEALPAAVGPAYRGRRTRRIAAQIRIPDPYTVLSSHGRYGMAGVLRES
ncbi:hypothetical protein [Dactylosporangium sp. NPDC049140]|uniref:hypothetical protein n=1 Tax=Dactylosporangium sp. NPDC049140 TaxID=3155647 RepID=UPI0033EA4BA8